MNLTTLRVLREFVVSDEPLSGSVVARAIETQRSIVYRVLHRLRDINLIELHATLRHSSEPTSYWYTLTRKGHEAYLTELLKLLIPEHKWKIDR